MWGMIITRLMWTTWTPMSSVSPWMNDHCLISYSHGYFDKLKGESVIKVIGLFRLVYACGLSAGIRSAGDSVPETLVSNPAFSRRRQLFSFRVNIISLLPVYQNWYKQTCKCIDVCLHIGVSTPRPTDSYPDQLLDSEWFLVKSSPGDGWIMLFPYWFEYWVYFVIVVFGLIQ